PATLTICLGTSSPSRAPTPPARTTPTVRNRLILPWAPSPVQRGERVGLPARRPWWDRLGRLVASRLSYRCATEPRGNTRAGDAPSTSIEVRHRAALAWRRRGSCRRARHAPR